MSAIKEFLGWLALIWLVALMVVGTLAVSLDLLARISRYIHYRRAYPSAPRGRVWSHVRERR